MLRALIQLRVSPPWESQFELLFLDQKVEARSSGHLIGGRLGAQIRSTSSQFQAYRMYPRSTGGGKICGKLGDGARGKRGVQEYYSEYS